MNKTLLVCLAAASVAAAGARAGEMFPFVIPGLDTPSKNSIADVAWLNDAPAGKHGFVSARDGRFVDGRGKRLKFLATNFTFGSCFPDHDTADKLAARLASLGINCIRFHHTDNQSAPRGIWKAGTPKKNEFDPDQLDRLDYFIAALKRHGIYANINLHISRNYWEGEDFADGLTDHERREQLPHYGKGVDKINDQMIRMQRDYARALLGHVNPYTKAPYAKDPCVAIVEINNENPLLQLKVAALPDYYRNDVLTTWNAWLKARYGSAGKLVAAWGGSAPLGDNLLPAKCATQGGENFHVVTDGSGETRVSLRKLPAVNWHAQLHWTGLTLDEGKLYTVEFAARSDAPRKLPLSTRLQKADWHNCGLSETAELTPQWNTFSHTFRGTRVEPGTVRFDFVLGDGPVGDFHIKNLTLCPGGTLGLKPGESIAAGTVGSGERSVGTPRGLDWTRFLAGTERAYTDGMRAFLKKDLGVRANIIDTQASYGGIAGTYRESFNDFVDMHAYWQHPHFPGRPWDGNNWRIQNTPMVAAKDTGNLMRLAAYRVAGKAFTVSEYDHPAPSHYAAEMFPMIASFAAVQDWDGFFQFDWGGTDGNDGKINGYFALQQHPGKLAFLPGAALMFRRGDVAPARGTACLNIPAGQVEKLAAENVSMTEAWKKADVEPRDCLTHRFNVRFTRGGELEADKTKTGGSQVALDAEAALYTVDAPAAKAVVGRCTGKTTTLGSAEFDVKSNSRNFASITLNAADGKPVAASKRLLLVAAGNIENTGMGWNADHTSVSRNWGSAPTICEGIAARVTLATQLKSAKVFVLNASGARSGEVPSTLADGKLTFAIGPQFKTLWYEIAP
ncbi:MAG: cellulase family glycosylhydrolase [Verrucomicrobia bacterium]|nr:cellulase family glycosylhydrolase [Verrucomicrobiota bacterium]